jgi:hypothetical protein
VTGDVYKSCLNCWPPPNVVTVLQWHGTGNWDIMGCFSRAHKGQGENEGKSNATWHLNRYLGCWYWNHNITCWVPFLPWAANSAFLLGPWGSWSGSDTDYNYYIEQKESVQCNSFRIFDFSLGEQSANREGLCSFGGPELSSLPPHTYTADDGVSVSEKSFWKVELGSSPCSFGVHCSYCNGLWRLSFEWPDTMYHLRRFYHLL